MKKHVVLGLLLVVLAAGWTVAQDTPYSLKRILGLADVETEAAVPALIDVLRTSQDVRQHAAAQALYQIGTPAARAALADVLGQPAYDVLTALDLTFHWGMEPAARNGMIRDYLLTSPATDLAVNVSVRSAGSNDWVFVLTFKNVGRKPYRLFRSPAYLGRYLVLTSADGQVMRPLRTREMSQAVKDPDASYPRLVPGATVTFEIPARVEKQKRGESDLWVLDTGDMIHELAAGPGSYQVRALYQYDHLSGSHISSLWTGRVVSAPLTLSLGRE